MQCLLSLVHGPQGQGYHVSRCLEGDSLKTFFKANGLAEWSTTPCLGPTASVVLISKLLTLLPSPSFPTPTKSH